MSTALGPLTAALADRYRIERELGAGGMATVYLAQDLRHDRKVAIKVLRPELAAVIGAERFLAEIRTTANLQHPHILPLFDSGAAGQQGSGEGTTFLFYVMPYVEGESLRDRLTRSRQLPIGDAVRIAGEIASALDYAHRHGVIHRDIKPENILLHDGRALVADFGIALAASKAGGGRMTQTGMSLGTPNYMSPEQAMGEREIGPESDVYALGAVTYEMLAGEPPFTGPTAQSIIARVMTEEPRPLATQRKSVQPEVEAAVFTALEKLPADRFASAAEFASALGGQTDRRTVGRKAPRKPATVPPFRRPAVLAGAGVLLLVGGVLLGRAMGRDSGDASPMIRATLDLGDSTTIPPVGNIRLAVSPDGRRMVFVGRQGSDASLWLRELNQPDARRLPDTRGAFAPFFSPDGEFIGFFTGSSGRIAMKVIPVIGGVARTVVQDSVASFGGADWGDDGQIYFTNAARGLSRVPANGGAITLIASPDSGTGVKEYDYPDALPGSRQAFVMLWKGSLGSNRIGVIDLATGALQELATGSYARYLAPDHVAIGAGDGKLLVARYDQDSRRLIDTPVLMLDDVQDEISNGTVQFAVAGNGTLIYQSRQGGEVGVVWVDRSGAERLVDSTLKGNYSDVALSPTASRIALAQSVMGGGQIWVRDLATGASSQISQELTDAGRPVWSPDGRNVGFLATRGIRRTAWIRRADGSDSARVLVPGSSQHDEVWFEKTGRFTLFRSVGAGEGTRYLMFMENGVDTVPRVLLRARFDNFAPTLSPDGRWLAYVSNESGNSQVYVRPFPNVDSAKFTISAAGGLEPLWRRDGAELFFRNPQGDMFAVSIGRGREFEASAPRLLFSRPGLRIQEYFRSYDVHPDGQRFLMLSTGASKASSFKVILNWRPSSAAATVP
jgi:serine/threonine protein kinase/Tol biopolymer transport system component